MKYDLTVREMQVLKMIVYEHTTDEIAAKLHIDSETIRTHRKNLRSKLGARNVAGVVRKAFEYNLLSFPESV
ncbi:MAG: helix-turn-helix transcriptional regulator [Saprospiraceae bacterium]|nr:helix-turn-helix transcriptional regulator [Saprospiraceae bacterium]